MKPLRDLEPGLMKHIYRSLLLARRMDERLMVLLRQGKSHFHIGSSGHEAAQVAAALLFNPGEDWAFPYYRDLPFVLEWGMTPYEVFLHAFGKAKDPSSGGRQMPSHWGHRKLNIFTQSSPTGTQYLHAVGVALGMKLRGTGAGTEESRETEEAGKGTGLGTEEKNSRMEGLGTRIAGQGTEGPETQAPGAGERLGTGDNSETEKLAPIGKVYVSSGEGTTSQGDFYEAVNMACREKLPVFFHIENNNYAISVPYERQAAGVDASTMLAGYPNLFRGYVDGTDFFLTFETIRAAMEHIVAGKGPALVVSETVRLLAHSSSDDQRKYRSLEELASDAQKDPILRFKERCNEMGCVSEAEAAEIEADIEVLIAVAERQAQAESSPHPSTAAKHVFVDTSDASPGTEVLAVEPVATTPRLPPALDGPGPGADVVMVDAINHGLAEEMARDERIVLYGEDVEDGKGGVFGATRGLSQRFGRKRVFNSPLAESTIIGSAIGLAAYGFKPVVEIQFVDFIWPGFNQLKSELATIHYRSNGEWKVPVVIRTPVGGYIHGGLYHSQSEEAIFAHIPGLKVIFPSNAADAKGLLKSAIRQDDPVLFLEHKALYRQRSAARSEPGANVLLPLGKANLVATGNKLTIVTWGMQVHKVQQALLSLGLVEAADVLDLRTLVPLDWASIEASVRKTGKLLIVHEARLTGGFGAEISARAAEHLFESLDAPVRRIAALDTHNPYAAELEAEVLPQVERIAAGIRDLLAW